MKKVIISLCAIAASVNIMAAINITDKAKITFTAGAVSNSINLIQSPDLEEGVNKDYCGELIDKAERAAVLYVINGTKEYLSFGSKNLSDMALGVKTNGSTNYTLSFSKVAGDMSIYDAVLDSVIIITEGGSYVFEAASSVADRFILNRTEPALCHQYGKLLVAGHQGESLVVTDMDDNEKINITIASNNEAVELDALEAGKQYKVILNGADAVIIRK